MAADFTRRGGTIELIDRDAERDTLDRLMVAIRAGQSQALVVSGEAGVGKTALLDSIRECVGLPDSTHHWLSGRHGIGLPRAASAVRAHAGWSTAFACAAA